jgi:uncharacterized RDD family membrane protein YckC
VSYDEHQQVDAPAVPGWGAPFPPEQPRRDAEERPHDAGMPTAASVAAASALGEEAVADFTNEDRRPLDRRRRKARAIDNLILVPVALAIVKLNGGFTIGAVLLVLALELSYFFVFESLQGQTLGKRVAKLRVVHPDGSAPTTGRIALRTILRPLDYTLVGIVAVLASGPRRQRLGDRAANTIVRDDNRTFHRAPESPLLVAFPLVLIGAAIVAMLTLKPGDPMLAKRNAHPYMAKIDRICEKRTRQGKALEQSGQFNLLSMRTLLRQEQRKIEKLPKPPREVKADVAAVVAQHRRVNRLIDRMSRDMDRSVAPAAVAARYEASVPAVMATANEKFEQLGLPYCEL